MIGTQTSLGAAGAFRLSVAASLLVVSTSLWIATYLLARESSAELRAAGNSDGTRSVIETLVKQERYLEAFSRAVARVSGLSEALGLDSPASLDALEQVAVIAHRAGDQNLAELLLEVSLARRRVVHGERSPEVAESLHHEGLVARFLGRYEQARQLHDQAIQRLAPHRATHGPLLAEAIQAQASWLRHVELDRAIDGYADALAVRLENPETPRIAIADNLVWLGWTTFQAGRHEEAALHLAEAERLLREAGLHDHTLMGVLLSVRADELAIHGAWAAAAQAYEASTAIFEVARRKHFPGFPRRKSPPHGYATYALTQLMQGRDEEAWTLLQRARGAVTSDFLQLARWQELRPDTWREITDLRRATLAAEEDLRDAAPEAQLKSILRLLDLRARTLELEQAFLDAHPPREAPSLTALQAALAPEEAFVGWVDFRLGNHHGQSRGPSRAEIWAYVIRRDSIRWVPLMRARTTEEARATDESFRRYSHALRIAAGWPERVEPDEELDRLRREVGSILMDPVLPELHGKKVLIVELSNLVPELPIEALILADGTVVKERFAVSYIHSAETYMAMRRTDPDRSDLRRLPALIVGDPAFGAESPYLPLPFSSQEIAGISSLFPSASVLRGAAATEARLDELARSGRLREFGILHFATHVVSGGHLERSAVVLSPEDEGGYDGLVDAAEILAGWRLRADVVALSGCHSLVGRGPADSGEYLGFTQVLLAAGARSVLASLWRVDDEATAHLMKRFYENLMGQPSTRASRAQALREAGLWLRRYVDEEGRRPFEHPVYWSGFIVIGPPGSPR
ncbi:MAG: CHAT domain-containing protein [Candidatus Polarisedimenticolia bacterium]